MYSNTLLVWNEKEPIDLTDLVADCMLAKPLSSDDRGGNRDWSGSDPSDLVQMFAATDRYGR